jgi:WD40 repeat protein
MDGYAVLARTLDGQEVYRLLHEDWVTDIAFNSNSSWFATVSNDNRIRLWDTGDGEERLRMAQDGFVNEVRISANDQWLATTGADQTVRVWNASTGTEMFQIPLKGAGMALGFSGDGKSLVAGDAGGEINVWDISVMPAPENYLQFTGLAGDVKFSPSGDWLAASDGPRVWLLRPNQLSTLTTRTLITASLTLNGDVANLAFSPDSVWLGASTTNGQVLVYNLQTRQPKTLFQTGLGYQITFTPDSIYLISCSSTGVVEMWSLASFRKIAELAGEGSGAVSIAASSDHLTVGMTDKIAIFTLNGEPLTQLESPGDHTRLVFNADGSLLASSNPAGLVKIWKFENGNYTLVGSIRKDSVYSLAFNPNGRVLAVGSRNSVYLVEPFTVKEIARIPHAGDVTGLSYSADGNRMATASLRAAQFWDMAPIPAINSDDLVSTACSRLSANFSPAQWSNLFGSEEYRELCPGLPVP